jgi:ribose-phosphate pyrophosphokinase
MSITVLSAESSKELASCLASRLDAELVDVDVKVFPDGESKVRIPKQLEGKDVVVVHSTHPPVDKHMMQLFFILSKVSRVAASTIVFIPYLGYARQDREFLEGEVVSISTIADIICSYNIKALITFDAHSMLALSYFKVPVHNISAIPLLADYFLKHVSIDLSNTVAVSPDAGSASRVEEFARLLKCKYIVLKKSRDRVTGEVRIDEHSISKDNLKDKVAIIVDDMISTGSSVITAIDNLKRSECKDIYVTCTHALMLNDAYKRILDAGARDVIASNTVPSPASKVDVSDLAGKEITSILATHIAKSV